MENGTEYVHAEKYESNEVKLFAQNSTEESQSLAFLYPVMAEHLKLGIPGKKVLDIGCGPGNWTYKAALCGAKSVDGFDINEEMVKLAKQATSQFSTVNICVGDMMKMPYDDNVFDVALSFFVTTVLQLKAFISHFKELYRVLVPGGKVVVVTITKAGYEKMHLRSGTDLAMMEDKIEKILMSLKSYPSQVVINDSFRDLTNVLSFALTLNQNGQLERITDADKMSNGQATWAKTQ